MSKMKPRICAQRKFAQGVYVPVYNGPNERRQATPTSKDCDKETVRIVFKNMTPTHLLDLVALKNVCRHMKPVVLLEKLKNNSQMSPKGQQAKEEKHTDIEKNNTVTKTIIKTMKKTKRKLRSTLCIGKDQTMPLKQIKRTELVKPKVVTKIIKKSKRSLRSTVTTTKAQTPMSPPKPTKTIDTEIRKRSAPSDSDDDQPLKSLYNKKNAINKETPKKIQRDHHTEVLRKRRVGTGTIKSIKIERPVTRYGSKKRHEWEQKGKLQRIKKRLIVNVDRDKVKKDREEVDLKKEVELPEPVNPFYSVNGIENWMDKSLTETHRIKKQYELVPEAVSSSPEGPDQELFKLPQKRPRKLMKTAPQRIFSRRISSRVEEKQQQKPEIQKPKPQQTPEVQVVTEKKPKSDRPKSSNSSCPSLLLHSMQSLEDTANINLKDSCKKCADCGILQKIYEHMQTNADANTSLKESKKIVEKDTSNDVYTFHVEADSIPIADYRQQLQTEKEEVHHLYVDLFGSTCENIVQIFSDKDSNQAKPLMRARLIPRAKVNKNLINKGNEDTSFFWQQANFLTLLLNGLKKNNEERDCNKQKDENNEQNEEVIEPVVKKEPNVPKEDEVVPNKDHKIDTTDSASKKDKPLKGFPKSNDTAKLVEAPTYKPTPKEFENPLTYIEKIKPQASKYGICKIIPPDGFSPTCNLPEDIDFLSGNQYIGKMYMRWGPASREMCAIKSYLGTQNVVFKRAPLIDGIEVNLPKLYHIVQAMGGLKHVIQKKKWCKVAEEMNYPKRADIEKKLDRVYVKYILPYDTLSGAERNSILVTVERQWTNRYLKMMNRAQNPLHRQKILLGESSSEDEEDCEEPQCLQEAEDCVLPGRTMNLKTFEKIAKRCNQMYFPNCETPTAKQVESQYWRYVLFGSDHICVNTASIDTGEQGYGFTKTKEDPYSKHPWNLKVLSNSPGTALRSMGPVLSVTVPTLHLGMLFTTSCWHRDPHGLPWIEYLHMGGSKTWYGIPDEQSNNFRTAVESLGPAYCQNKSIWLPSDIAMIPPQLLTENNVSLSRTTQCAGEFIVVFPKAYSCSICTGYSISESVYFAPTNWLMTMQNDFQDVRESCEPTMFSLEHLLISMANDSKLSSAVLVQVHSMLSRMIQDEIVNRTDVKNLGVLINVNKPSKKRWNFSWNVGEHTECDICRRTLYLSKVTGVNGKNSDLCLEHALRLLKKPGRVLKDINLICFFSDDSLTEVSERLQKKLEASFKS